MRHYIQFLLMTPDSITRILKTKATYELT